MTPATGTSTEENGVNLDVPFLSADEQPATGLVMDQQDGGSSGSTEIWKLNAVMALICCWVTMILTGWGTIEDLNENQNAANPTAGRVNMAMIGVSQWVAIGLYMWTLLAPRMFPDRDFS